MSKKSDKNLSGKEVFEREAIKRGYTITTSNDDYILQDCQGRRKSLVSVATKDSYVATLSYRAVYNFDFDYDDFHDVALLVENEVKIQYTGIPLYVSEETEKMILFWDEVNKEAKRCLKRGREEERKIRDEM